MYLGHSNVDLLLSECPTQNPDLNLIQMMWQDLKWAVHAENFCQFLRILVQSSAETKI